MRIIYILAMLLLTQGLYSQDNNSHKYILDKDKITILKTGKYERGTRFISLKKEDLAVVEEILQKCIDDHNKGLDSSDIAYEFINLDRYRRQYIPYKINGKSYVWVNCFCGDEKHFPGWKKRLVSVRDGGKCYFNVLIDLLSKLYTNFYINGVAQIAPNIDFSKAWLVSDGVIFKREYTW